VTSPTACLDISTPETLDAAIDAVLAALLAGGVVVVPTDTVYGLMCLPRFDEAARSIFAMKQRPADRRLPIIVADAGQARRDLPLRWTATADALATAFWPGALTIACGTRPPLPPWLAGRDEVAVRAPAHGLVQGLARRAGPLLMTSANRHGAPTPNSVHDVLADLAAAPALAVDGGRLTGASSTLVNTNLPAPEIERDGAIPAGEIEAILGRGR
jgi:L-threonylcarbamoyladenylate synthase